MRPRRAGLLGVAITVGLTFGSAMVGSGVAHADNPAYLKALADAGINTPRGEYEVKEWGWEICELRKRGKPPRQWVEQAIFNDSLHPPYGLTIDQANFIVDTAIRYLCDDRDGPPPYEPLP